MTEPPDQKTTIGSTRAHAPSPGASEPNSVFAFFNEIGIIAQLTRARFERVLPDGMTVPQFSVINHLVRLGDGKSPLSLANAFQVPKATMTNTLAGLVKRNLVRFAPHPKDGRSKLVYLTDDGRSFRDEAIARLVPEFSFLAEQFDLDQLGNMLPTLRELRELLDRSRDA
ncbi:MAG: MarR family transcriptional regulator [Pseudomonadota bacterium]